MVEGVVHLAGNLYGVVRKKDGAPILTDDQLTAVVTTGEDADFYLCALQIDEFSVQKHVILILA